MNETKENLAYIPICKSTCKFCWGKGVVKEALTGKLITCPKVKRYNKVPIDNIKKLGKLSKEKKE